MQLRAYREEDAPALLALFRDTIRRVNARDYSPEQVRAWASEDIDPGGWAGRFAGRFAVVVESGERAIGFADLEPDGHIDRFFVSADHQRRGSVGPPGRHRGRGTTGPRRQVVHGGEHHGPAVLRGRGFRRPLPAGRHSPAGPSSSTTGWRGCSPELRRPRTRRATRRSGGSNGTRRATETPLDRNVPRATNTLQCKACWPRQSLPPRAGHGLGGLCGTRTAGALSVPVWSGRDARGIS